MATIQKFQASDGVNIPYRIRGNGPAVLFIHGIFASSKDFNPIVDMISERYTCITFDLRGHGASTATKGFTIARNAQDIHELTAYLGIEDVTLIGHSLGAFTMFSYYEQFSDQYIRQLYFIDITPKIVNSDGWTLGLYQGEYTKAMLELDIKSLQSGNYVDNMAYFVYRNYTPYRRGKRYKTRAPWIFRVVAKKKMIPTPMIRKMALSILQDIGQLDFRSMLSDIKIDATIIYADPGSLFPATAAFYMDEHIHGKTQLVKVANATHHTILHKQYMTVVNAINQEKDM
ncbi:MAG: alpha/beta hydrolase [Clostridiales Family XIII bacterium]|nr:alpha/beta hydrolase [Clostridiales Family XIII bacterium]